MADQAYDLYTHLLLAAYRARDNEQRLARLRQLCARAWRRYSRRWNAANGFGRQD